MSLSLSGGVMERINRQTRSKREIPLPVPRLSRISSTRRTESWTGLLLLFNMFLFAVISMLLRYNNHRAPQRRRGVANEAGRKVFSKTTPIRLAIGKLARHGRDMPEGLSRETQTLERAQEA